MPPLPPFPGSNFFVIPYIKGIPKRFYSIIHDSSDKLAFSLNNKLNGLIKLYKDSSPRMNHSNVIYKILCKDCNASYVGQTGRRLAIRLKEYKSNVNYSSDYSCLNS